MMKKVLVVDYDEDLAEMVTMVLSRAGMQVQAIGRGELFFDAVLNFKPDVILMDIYLGEQDGRALCRSLKTGNGPKTVPVILYSAGNISQASVAESGADAFIPKPFGNDEIVEKINALA